MPCPCGSQLSLDKCCGAYLAGTRHAPTAEALMRSRFSAYVLRQHDYLLQSWHADSRPPTVGGTTLHWIGLQILRCDQGSEQDSTGTVTFAASFIDEHGKGKQLCEKSHFVREEGRWFYVDGACTITEIARNAPCPCGSGRKFKRCCAAR